MNWLKSWLEQERPGLVVIDSLTSSNRFSETDENDSSYGRSLYQLRDLANEYHCNFLVLHHTNKLGGARGSTAIRRS
jgi:RecA-family ATPase